MGINDPTLEVFSVKEAAELLKTSCQQIRKMIQDEELFAVKVGREWRIPNDAIREFLNDPMTI